MTASPRLAKLTRPRSEGLLRRERLFAELDEASKRPVLWIAGPPGAGKTSLVASYLEARKLSGVWYQIDRNDADPATFFYYLGVAVGELAGKKTKPLPLFTEDFAADLAGFSRRFFRELFAVLPARPVIVLDNYQEADERSALHAVMKEALEELPDSVHIIAISRAEPPVEFAARARCTAFVAIGLGESQADAGRNCCHRRQPGPGRSRPHLGFYTPRVNSRTHFNSMLKVAPGTPQHG